MVDDNAFSHRIIEEVNSQGVTLRFQPVLSSSVAVESGAAAQHNLSNIANHSNQMELVQEERKSVEQSQVQNIGAAEVIENYHRLAMMIDAHR